MSREIGTPAWLALPNGNFSEFPEHAYFFLPSHLRLLDAEVSYNRSLISVQALSRVLLFATPWTACSTPGHPAHHQVPELTQTHVHRVSDAIQLSHPVLSPSPPAFNLSQHQGLFQ